MPGSHYEKVYTAYAEFSLNKKFLATNQFFLIKPIVKKIVDLLVIRDKNQKQKPLQQSITTNLLQESHCTDAIAT